MTFEEINENAMYTPHEVAAMVGVHYHTILRAIWGNRIEAELLFGRWKITGKAIKAYRERMRTPMRPAPETIILDPRPIRADDDPLLQLKLDHAARMEGVKHKEGGRCANSPAPAPGVMVLARPQRTGHRS